MWLLTPPPNILEGIVKDFKFNVFLSRNRMSGKFVILGCKKTRKLDVAHFTIMFILYFPKIRPNIYSSCEYWLSATILIVMYYKQCRLLQANQVWKSSGELPNFGQLQDIHKAGSSLSYIDCYDLFITIIIISRHSKCPGPGSLSEDTQPGLSPTDKSCGGRGGSEGVLGPAANMTAISRAWECQLTIW